MENGTKFPKHPAFRFFTIHQFWCSTIYSSSSSASLFFGMFCQGKCTIFYPSSMVVVQRCICVRDGWNVLQIVKKCFYLRVDVSDSVKHRPILAVYLQEWCFQGGLLVGKWTALSLSYSWKKNENLARSHRPKQDRRNVIHSPGKSLSGIQRLWMQYSTIKSHF